jgi:hypothetical protein
MIVFSASPEPLGRRNSNVKCGALNVGRSRAKSTHRDGEAARGGEQPARACGLVPAVAHVGLADTVDHQHIPADPDARVGMVLGVQREHPAGADDQMIDVSAVVPDRNRMQVPPSLVTAPQPVELRGHADLALRTELPGTFLRVHPHQPPEKRSHRRCFAGTLRFRPCQFAGRVQSKVYPGGRCVGHSLGIDIQRWRLKQHGGRRSTTG